MSTTITALGAEDPGGGHCCSCQPGCTHKRRIYCIQHARQRYAATISTSSAWPVGPTPHADCGTECACYWRGRRDEAKA